ncbi:MAG: helix-hairpin-helix domain-containing protein [candidate division Zixibacteria bacterium]|nr:helix-hairpin-helix domain-containing protein [candidate division Zixibacteria bacterium]
MKVVLKSEVKPSRSKILFIKIIFILFSLVVIWQQSGSWVGAIDLKSECQLYKEKAGPNFKKIDINKATEEDLIALPGIGIKTARAIVAYRETIGGYKSLEQLQLVRGVGDKVYDCLKDLVTIVESH